MTVVNNKTIHRFKLLSTIISFMLICSALLLVADTPATGYEISIYSATPTIFWIGIIFGLLNGMVLIASDLYSKNGKIWIIGLFQILFCNCSVIFLYALRGYVLYLGMGDTLSYVGLAKDISEFGNFGSNFYPITSILISQFSQFSNLPILFISKYVSSFLFIFYVLSVYCWSKSIIADKKFVLSSLIASTPIFFAWFSTSIYHEVLSVFTLPFFFYILQRNSDYRFRFFSIIFLIVYPFFHPIIGIVVLLYVMALFISEKFNLSKEIKNISTTLLLISFIALIAWFIQQYALLRSVKHIFFQLIGLLKTPTTSDSALYYLNRLGVTTALRTLVLMIFDEIVFCLISLLVIYKFFLRKDTLFLQKLSKISVCFIIGNLFLLILFFSTRTHVPDRLINLNFNIILTYPLVGYLLYNFLLNNKSVKAILILSLIFVSSVTAVFSLYPSPITMRPNNQVTFSGIKGMDWLIIQKDLEFKTAIILSPIVRYADLIYGCAFRKGRNDLHGALGLTEHFGFTEKDVFPIDKDRYLVITEFDVQAYTKVWKDIDTFRKEDFIKVDFCTNVDKIYESGEFRIYFVHDNN